MIVYNYIPTYEYKNSVIQIHKCILLLTLGWNSSKYTFIDPNTSEYSKQERMKIVPSNHQQNVSKDQNEISESSDDVNDCNQEPSKDILLRKCIFMY